MELLALRNGLLADLAGGDLHVLLGDGGHHVERAEVQRGQLIGVEPGAETVVSLPQIGNVGHAWQPPQFVADVDRGIVAKKNVVVAVVRRNQVHDHQGIRRDLFDRDALVLNQRRDDRQGQRHSVLHQHLSHVRVHAQLEGDQQAVGAVVGRLRRHVHHAFDAADLLFDRRGHRIAHGLGVGPGIDRRHQDRRQRHHDRRRQRHDHRCHRRHHDRRRGHFGILRDGQSEHGHPARQHEHDRQHGGEDRTIYEEV